MYCTSLLKNCLQFAPKKFCWRPEIHTRIHTPKPREKKKEKRQIVYISSIEILPAESADVDLPRGNTFFSNIKNAIRDNQQVNNTFANTLVPRKDECQLSRHILKTKQIFWANEKNTSDHVSVFRQNFLQSQKALE